VDDVAPPGILQVDANTALVAIEAAEETDCKSRQAARAIASRWLDPDDLRAEICEHHPAARTHHGVAEIEHSHAREGQLTLRHSLPPGHRAASAGHVGNVLIID
jgi:hypothetical protein